MMNSTSVGGTGAVYRAVERTDYAVAFVSAAVAVMCLSAMFLSMLAEVVVRYMTNQGMGWPIELPAILYPWLVMGGIVYAAQRAQHIAVTALQSVLGRRGNRVLLLAHQLLLAATFVYLAWVGLDVIEITGAERFPVTGITGRWAYLALVAGYVGLSLTATTTFLRLLLVADPLSVRVHHVEEEL